jgi:hypothetical protein
MEVLALLFIVGIVVYCKFTTQRQQKFHLFLMWCGMVLSIVMAAIYPLARLLLD